MMPLHRHQIAWLRDDGWRSVLARDWDAAARDCLTHWAEKRLPLVVTRQPDHLGDESVALGLPAPGRWGRRRLAFAVARSEVMYFDEFPLAEAVLGLLPAATRPAWRGMCVNLKAVGAPARVYGSYGWQLLSGLVHVSPGSDIDLWLSVSDARQADAAAACLQLFSSDQVRLDGELMFLDGTSASWREWAAWRGGHAKRLLVKTLRDSSLVGASAWQGMAEVAVAKVAVAA